MVRKAGLTFLLCALAACGSETPSNNVSNTETTGTNGQTNSGTNGMMNSRNPDGCPEQFQQYGDACPAADLADGDTCAYSGCNEPGLACVDGTWRLVEGANPEADGCRNLCDATCERLVDECGISWGDCCHRACYSNFACPGETIGQDEAICDGEKANVDAMSCSDLVLHVREDWRAEDACGSIVEGE